jgi:hypothetical protein
MLRSIPEQIGGDGEAIFSSHVSYRIGDMFHNRTVEVANGELGALCFGRSASASRASRCLSVADDVGRMLDRLPSQRSLLIQPPDSVGETK